MKTSVVILLLGLLALAGCKEQKGGPSTADYQAKRSKVLAKAREGSMERAKAGKKSQKKAKKQAAPGKAQPKFAAMGSDYSYVRQGKRDPFRSYVLNQAKRKAKGKRGPLEQYDLSQLKVRGVVWDTSNARALIQVPSGRAYIVGTGTAIGKNSGKIIGIDDNTVLVKERYVDFLGEETTKDIKLRVRR